ncbi:MAG: hypothetical protein A2Y76_08610 [Planctomycetes bacterium RBG_13_60_9]|nr:MAG: hypothetical protein A2Y76_08610 [Planctomycetes bacterium RBG_13_60_9]
MRLILWLSFPIGLHQSFSYLQFLTLHRYYFYPSNLLSVQVDANRKDSIALISIVKEILIGLTKMPFIILPMLISEQMPFLLLIY